MSNILDYRAEFRSRRRFVAIAIATVASVLALGLWKWDYLRHSADRLRTWLSFRACCRFEVAPSQVLFTEVPSTVAILAANANYALDQPADMSFRRRAVLAPECLLDLSAGVRRSGSAQCIPAPGDEPGLLPDPWFHPCLAYCHGVEASDGKELLLIIEINTSADAGPDVHWCTVSVPNPFGAPAVTNGGADVLHLGEPSHFDMLDARPAAIAIGQKDTVVLDLSFRETGRASRHATLTAKVLPNGQVTMAGQSN